MDDLDRKLLNEIQIGFPIAQRPFRDLGVRLDCSEDEILRRIKRLKKQGIIRRIGGNFDSRRLGFTTTLCAAKVADDKISRFVEADRGGESALLVLQHTVQPYIAHAAVACAGLLGSQEL